jgi:hypothetical protein
MTDPKFTAADIQQDNAPEMLADLQRLITTHLDKAWKYDEKAEQNRTSAGCYLVQAREACDEGGFKAFHKKFLPDLSRATVYQLLAIGSGKTSAEDVRERARARKAKQREREKESVCDVTDTLAPQAAEPSVTSQTPPAPQAAPIDPEDPHAAHRRLMEKLGEESLVDHWRRCADELRDLLEAIGAEALVKAMSSDFRAEVLALLMAPKSKTNSATAEHQSKH